LVTTGTATAGSDYAPFSTSVTIGTGQGTADVAVPILSDSLVEGSETVRLALGMSTGFLLGTPDPVTATISDRPLQDWLYRQGRVGEMTSLNQDTDADGDSWLTEYFKGTSAGDGRSFAPLSLTTGVGGRRVRYSRSQGISDVEGHLMWSKDLLRWFRSSESDGIHSVTISEQVVSAPGTNPETVEAILSVSGSAADPLALFLRLDVNTL
jgi:hypothetical protein